MNRASTLAVLGYMACSALMLLVNKLAVHHLGTPSFVLLMQLASSAGVCWLLGKTGAIEVDALEVSKVKRFWVVPLAFLCTIFANIKILQYANVETFIVFRACTPLLVSVADYVWLGRELPSRRSWACLLLLAIGAVSYVLTDKFFRIDAYAWVVVWFAVFCFDQVYIKHKVDSVKMTTWGRVFYTNVLALGPLLVVLMATGEVSELASFSWTSKSLFWLVSSCAMGVAIAYFSFLARAAVSATYFTVIGNTCKVITVILNVLLWDLHASPKGLASLGVCLIGAYLYKQAPLRADSKTLPL